MSVFDSYFSGDAIEKLSDRKILIFLSIFALIILLSPLMMRLASGVSLMFNEESYYNSRIAERLIKGESLISDNLSGIIKPFYVTPYHYLLAFFGLFFNIASLSYILPIIFGLLTVILLYLIMTHFDLHKTIKSFTVLFFISSPVFVHTFSYSNHYFSLVFFVLLAIFLFIQEKYIYSIISIPIIGIIYFYGFFNALFILILFLLFSLYYKEKHIWFLSALFLVFLLYAVYSLNNYYFFDIFEKSYLTGFIFEFGSKVGFSIFLILLFIIGFFVTWENKKKIYPVYMLIIALFTLSFFNSFESLLYLSILFSLFASYGFSYLYKKVWELNIMKVCALALILCALLISVLIFILLSSSLEPDIHSLRAAKWIGEKVEPNELILSYPSHSFIIQDVAKRKTFIDNIDISFLENSPNKNAFHEILGAQDIESLKSLLIKNEISIIYIDNELKEYSRSIGVERGLLYLLRNNETFKKVYKDKDIEIYRLI